MPRFISMYFLEADRVEAYEENEEGWRGRDPDDFVWQHAPNRSTAAAQHFAKLDEWEADPTRSTY